MGLVLLYLKFDNPNAAFTHTLNNLRYFINCGIVVLICSAVLLIRPNPNRILFAFLITIPLNIILQFALPDMNYFVRAFVVIITGLFIALFSPLRDWQPLGEILSHSTKHSKILGVCLLISLFLMHWIWS